jgi:membrane-bound lytic murein transglycosylase D
MHPQSHIATRLIVTLPTVIVLLVGCASQPAAVDYYMRADYQISARDSDIIRPTLDVVVLGGGIGYRSATYSGGNLWGRVRSRMGLGVKHNARVDKEIRRLKSNPKYLEQLSKRAQPYLHLIVREIERRGMPTELALLPEIESKYNPKALSHKSASGMWQFIPDTGRKYGLKQNAWYDGRNDIVASTRAALDYLQWLHRKFRGDWALALAGYNAGEGAVAAARRKNRSRGKGTDFWSLDLPSETELYVPKLLAVAKLMEKPRRYGMRPPHIPNGPQLELVDTGRQMDLARAAKLSGVRLADLRRLNPGLKRGKTLPSGPHKLLVPIGSGRVLRAKSSKSLLRVPTNA